MMFRMMVVVVIVDVDSIVNPVGGFEFAKEKREVAVNQSNFGMKKRKSKRER